jgi:hypothetical protein
MIAQVEQAIPYTVQFAYLCVFMCVLNGIAGREYDITMRCSVCKEAGGGSRAGSSCCQRLQ